MSDNPIALLQGGAAQLPSSLHAIMEQMSSSEMQANVGASFAVVTIKGKVFSIKFGGQNTPLTMNINGQTYAAPFFDVVIPKAKAELSKTFYPHGYSEGDDSAPTCWSEDGMTPLAPLPQRPIDPRTNAPCVDCRMCPNNQFGSKISETGSKGKACADTRKLIVVPCAPTGQKDAQGNDITVMDGENIRFGGAMLMRVPAASLKVFAEYDQKLQQMGVPYFGVVTRMEFDQTQSYPKFVLKALRFLTEQEGQKVAEIRDSLQVKQILESGQTGGAPMPASHQLPGPDLSALAGGQVPASLGVQASVQPVPVQAVQPVQAAPQGNVVPLQQPAPTPPPQMPPQAADADLVAAGWAKHPNNPAYYYKGQQVLLEAAARATLVPVAPPVQAAPPPPPVPQQVPLQMPPQGAAPTGHGPQVTPSLMNTVDSLLAS